MLVSVKKQALRKVVPCLILLIIILSKQAEAQQLPNQQPQHSLQQKFIDWPSLQWKELIDESEITIATAKLEYSSFVAVKSSMRVKARLNDIAALVLFVDGCHEGSTVCESIEKMSFQDPKNYFQYVVSKFPWPLKKRDIFLKINVNQDNKGVITVTGKSIADKFPENSDYVRIRQMSLEWKVTPESEGQVLIEHFIHSDPSGRIPAWLFNEAVVSTPLKTLSNIKRLLAIENDHIVNIDFINEYSGVKTKPN
jgi:hypothetical protein